MQKIYHIDLGLTDYNSTWQLQKQINTYKQREKCSDIIITNEHNHVYTLGKAGDRNHLLIDSAELGKQGISYYEIDRGGDLTYHGPGQLVCYPILDLNNYYPDIHRYLRDLEEVISRTLNHYGIVSHKDEEFTGVWVGEEKICAIGIKVTRWITMHGLAFNINNELGFFDNIIPCGIFHRGVTSMKKLLGKEVDFEEVKNLVLRNFEMVFSASLETLTPDKLKAYYHLDR